MNTNTITVGARVERTYVSKTQPPQSRVGTVLRIGGRYAWVRWDTGQIRRILAYAIRLTDSEAGAA